MLDLGAQYKARDAAKFAGVPQRKLALWFQRGKDDGYPIANGMDGGGSQGVHRQFSFRNIMEFALARAFVDQGVPPKGAFESAAKAAYLSTHEGGWGDDKIEPMVNRRIAGLPFPHADGDTYIFRVNGKTVVQPWANTDSEIANLFHSLRTANGGPRIEGFVAVNMSKVFEDVCARMGIQEGSELQRAYLHTEA